MSGSKKIYFLGIGGVAMGNAALMARGIGHRVGGSDGAIYPPMSNLLRENGIVPFGGFCEENLSSFAPDLVVVGNGVGRGNAEVEWLLDRETIPFTSLPNFLFQHFLRGRHRLVFAGTHGKTTTTAAAAFYLRQLGIAAGFFAGGAPFNFPTGADIGAPGTPFAIEGDEYDSAFFDKRSKFIHYAPDTLVVSAIDFDHADIFRDRTDVGRTFNHLLRTMPRRRSVFISGDGDDGDFLGPCPWIKIFRVGLGQNNDFRLQNLSLGGEGSSWEVAHGKEILQMSSSLGGEFNVRNCTMAVLAAHDALGTALPGRADLRGFRGVQRRQQLLHGDSRCRVYEDFGHHPRAIREVLRSLRLRHGGCELIGCFEPATHTALRRELAEEFVSAFSLGDRCYWGELRRPERIPAGERIIPGEIMGRLREIGVDAIAFEKNGELQERLLEVLGRESEKLRVVVLFSNASFADVLPYWRARGGGGA